MRSLTPQKYAQALYESFAEAQTVVDVQRVVDNFIRLIFENRDRKKFLAVIRNLEDIYHREGKSFDTEITSRFPFSVAEQKDFATALTGALGGEVKVRFATDPKLLGGVVLKINDMMYDGSLRRRIFSLSQKLRS